MDLLSLLRMNNIFAPQMQVPGADMNMDSAGDNNPVLSPQDYSEATKMFPMQHEAADRLKAVLDTIPNRENYEPHGFQRVMAGIAGMGAGGPAAYENGAALGFKNNPREQFEVTHGYLDEPYNKAVQDWSMKLKPLQELATAERGNNTNMRIAQNNYLQNERANRRITEIETHNRNQEEINRKNAESRAIRDKAYEYRAMHPDFKAQVAAGGYLVYVNPKNPQEQIWTGIDTGKLDDATKIDLGIQGRLREIGARGAEERKTEAVKEGDREALEGVKEGDRQADITARGEQARTTKSTLSGNSTAVKPQSATQQGRDLYNRAEKAIIAHPEWKEFIGLGQNNTVSLKTPPMTSLSHWQDNSKTLKDIRDYLGIDENGNPIDTSKKKPTITSIVPVK